MIQILQESDAKRKVSQITHTSALLISLASLPIGWGSIQWQSGPTACALVRSLQCHFMESSPLNYKTLSYTITHNWCFPNGQVHDSNSKWTFFLRYNQAQPWWGIEHISPSWYYGTVHQIATQLAIVFVLENFRLVWCLRMHISLAWLKSAFTEIVVYVGDFFCSFLSSNWLTWIRTGYYVETQL